MQFHGILGIFFAIAVAVFAVQNSAAVDIKFLTWQFSNVSVVLLILISTAVGALIAILLGLPRQLRQAIKMREIINKNHQLAAEIERLTKEKNGTKPQNTQSM